MHPCASTHFGFYIGLVSEQTASEHTKPEIDATCKHGQAAQSRRLVGHCGNTNVKGQKYGGLTAHGNFQAVGSKMPALGLMLRLVELLESRLVDAGP